MNTVRFFETFDSIYDYLQSNINYNWFTASVEKNRELLQRTDKLAIDFFQSTFKETTITYAVQALMQSFKYSPIGEDLLQCVNQDGKGTVLKRLSYNDLSPEAIAYSLYKYAQNKDIKMLRVSDLYRTHVLRRANPLEASVLPLRSFGLFPG